MKAYAVIAGICASAIATLAVAQGKVDYTGFWKKNCEDPFGLQIKALRGGLYAISFCKVDFCSEPGSYRPNTRIEHDPLYQIMGPSAIRVRHKEGGYTAYVKCTTETNPVLQYK